MYKIKVIIDNIKKGIPNLWSFLLISFILCTRIIKNAIGIISVVIKGKFNKDVAIVASIKIIKDMIMVVLVFSMFLFLILKFLNVL